MDTLDELPVTLTSTILMHVFSCVGSLMHIRDVEMVVVPYAVLPQYAIVVDAVVQLWFSSLSSA